MEYYYKTVHTPVGKLKLIASDKGLAAILWEDDDPKRVRILLNKKDIHHPILEKTEQQLLEYFAQNRKVFSVKLDFVGTAFQQKVWSALMTIPFGQIKTYSEIAAQIGNPKAVRAVGAAIGKNPISIIAPCHRVIGSSGKLVGFAGGLDIKRSLLDLEGRK